MIDLYYWPTPNGQKVLIYLEEAGLPYRLLPLDIDSGEQHSSSYDAVAPTHKMPAIVDQSLAGPGQAVFESGAILLYLAEKSGKLLPVATRTETLQWLFWQVSYLGPMAGQLLHFRKRTDSYARERYLREVITAFSLLDRKLQKSDFIAGAEYSIADISCFPWIGRWELLGQDLQAYPNLRRWYAQIQERGATQRALSIAETLKAGRFGTPRT